MTPVAEPVRPPVAIRIVRPYDSEDELLEHELETLGKTSVVLIGAHPRPTGVILRFEVTLASGATVLRGEGRVLAHKENAFRGQPGLTLRFTRLDPRSKAVVDRATSMREARSQGEGGSPSRPAPRAEGALADALTASTPAPSATSAGPSSAPQSAPQEDAIASSRATAREKANATARENAKRTGTGRTMGLTPPPVPVEAPPPPEDASPTPAPTPVTSVPGDVQDAPAERLRGEEAPTHVETHTAAPLATAPTISEPPLRSGRPGKRPGRTLDPPAAAADTGATIAAPTLVASMPTAADVPSGAKPAAVTPATAANTGAPLEAPADRADLLARLRERAGKLPPERIAEILATRR